MISNLKNILVTLILGLSLSSCNPLGETEEVPEQFGLESEINIAPTISDLGDRSVDEGQSVGPLVVSIADEDSELSCDESLSVVSSNLELVGVDNISIGGTAPDCSLTLYPKAQKSGLSIITLTVTDGELSSSDTINLTVNSVNDIPTISTVSNQILNEDQISNTLDVTIVDSDSSLTCLGNLSAVSSNTSLISTSDISIAGTAPDCKIILSPKENQNGASVITLQVTDGHSIATESFDFTVNAINDAPTISEVADQNINEDEDTSALAISIADIDNELTCSSITPSSSNTSLIDSAQITISGTAPSCTVTLSPKAEQSGSSVVTLTVDDGSLSATETINLYVNNVNDTPTISDVSDQSLSEDGSTGALALVINDPDSSLSCTSSLSASSSHTALIDAGEVVFGGTVPNCTVSLSPKEGQSGNAVVTLTVSDGSTTSTDTVNLSVSSVNDAPTISDVENQTIDEDGTTGALSVTILDSDSTLTCSDNLSASSSNTSLVDSPQITIAGTAPSCTLTLTPKAGQSGSATITLTVTDGSLSATDTVALTVNALFRPNQISGLQVWLDASDEDTLFQNSDCTTSASEDSVKIGCWKDKSGNDYHASVATDGSADDNRPTYLKMANAGSIEFDGQNDYFINSHEYTAREVFVVYKERSNLQGTGELATLWGQYSKGHIAPDPRSNKEGWSFDGNVGSQASYALLGGVMSSNTAGQKDPPDLVSGDGDVLGRYKWEYDNVEFIRAKFDRDININLQHIGTIDHANFSAGSHMFGGEISEIIVYYGFLSEANAKKIEGYLACKWDLQDSLVSGHPYKSTCP